MYRRKYGDFLAILSSYHHQCLQKNNLVPLNPHDEDTSTQSCLAAAQTPKEKKSEEIEVIARAVIDPECVVVIITTDPMVLLREKGNV